MLVRPRSVALVEHGFRCRGCAWLTLLLHVLSLAGACALGDGLAEERHEFVDAAWWITLSVWALQSLVAAVVLRYESLGQ